MAKVRGDDRTLELLDWEPPTPVRRYDERRVRAASLRGRISLAVAETLKDCELPRDEIAQRMSEWLGEDVSKHVLDAWASQARDDHTPSFLRVLALVHATGDARLLQLGAEMFGLSVIEDRYLSAVEDAMWADIEERARKRRKAARSRWKGGRP